VWLYVGFYGSQRQGDSIHSPLNCMPGSGWEPVRRTRRTLEVNDGPAGASRSIEINELLIQRGPEYQVVFYWYQSRGRVTSSEYWSKALALSDAIRLNRTDAAIVRVVAPVTGNPELARSQAASFVQALFPRLRALLPS
jgi:EpsI family protein